MDLRALHRFSSTHETALRYSKRAGCFHCGAIFAPAEIEEWIDDPQAMGMGQGRTALCPMCGVDAVLPSAEVNVTPELLSAMNKEWF